MADRDPGTRAGIAMAGEFAPVDRAAWEALAGDLDLLRSTTYDGVAVEPLYSADDPIAPPGLPGFPPFVRGRTAASTRNGGWDVRQRVDHRGRRMAVAELERGATSLLIDLRAAERIDVGLLAGVLDGVLLDVAPVVLDAGSRWVEGATALAELWGRLGVAADVVSGCLGADPIGLLACDRSTIAVDGQIADAMAWAGRMSEEHPSMRTFAIDGTRFHDAGASDAQELGFTIADVVATLRLLVDTTNSLDAAAAFHQMEIRLAATADQFATIAKFRAARRLLARVAEIAGVADAPGNTPLHAVSSSAMLTRYDPAVNMLRATVACFAAGVAGADAVTVLPYDDCIAPGSSELGRRLARNTQSVLAKESHLADVIDPAGGSWYVESLTTSTAEAAWAVFQAVERAGGFREAVQRGVVGAAIADVRDRRRADIARRTMPVTGVTEFPNVAETPPLTRDADDPDVAADHGSLCRHRWAEDVEALRQRVEVAAMADERPRVHLVPIGPPAAFTARAMFAKNFFEVAGIETRLGPVGDDPAGIARGFGGGVACICSSDELYRERGAAVAGALDAAGASRVYLAGTPGDGLDELRRAGVTHTIANGDDVLSALSDLAGHLGVP